MSVYAGGEFLCLNVCGALQEIGYRVLLASDVFSPPDMERIYGLGKIMEKCEHVQIPVFSPVPKRIVGLQRLAFAQRVQSMFWDLDAEIAFSTQSSSFLFPSRMFHFVYSSKDLFAYPQSAGPFGASARGGPKGLYLNGLRWSWNFLRKRHQKQEDWFFCVGSNVLQELRNKGYTNSSFVTPPCRVDFKPKTPKKNQVVQAARLIPDKKLETYVEIASRLPEYKFYLVGRNEPLDQSLNPGYAERILSSLPNNMEYVDALVRERPDLFEESKVYLYTGIELGIGLALVEAIAAGCIPLSPQNVGASDIIRAAKVGHLFSTTEDAVMIIKALMGQEFSKKQVLEISHGADRFSTDAFKRWIKLIATSVESATRVSDRRAM